MRSNAKAQRSLFFKLGAATKGLRRTLSIRVFFFGARTGCKWRWRCSVVRERGCALGRE
jgi:hypothetical protein